VTKEVLLATHQRIKPFIHRTDVLTSSQINTISGCEVFFKCENFQKMGAFKMRGATNAILCLSEEDRKKGVVTHSSGNFAQAVALAAASLNVHADIVMPKNAPVVKKNAVLDYGGNVIESESTAIAREEMADQVQQEKGVSFLHPSNQDEVIFGQGTAAMELLEDQPDLDFIITPVGGGGLIAGTARAPNRWRYI